MFENRMSEVVGFWERRFCITPWCQAGTLYVQRRGAGPDSWRVTQKTDQPEWLIASDEPVCPCCGGYLLTQANLDDGVEVSGA
jgi:hypothetical protein